MYAKPTRPSDFRLWPNKLGLHSLCEPIGAQRATFAEERMAPHLSDVELDEITELHGEGQDASEILELLGRPRRA